MTAVRKFFFEFSQHITIGRWMVLFALAALCIQSLIFPLELLHTYHLAIYSVWGCAVVASRDSDTFIARAWLPYPLFLAVVLLAPTLAWYRCHRYQNPK